MTYFKQELLLMFMIMYKKMIEAKNTTTMAATSGRAVITG
jgi:hypothetical protein